MTVSIKPVKPAAKGHNRFCGPAALSIIAGVDTAEAAAVIRFAGNKKCVMGTHDWDMVKALRLLGYKATSTGRFDNDNPKSNPTLAAWLKSDKRNGQTLYLVAAGNHWQVVQGRRYCCGLTKAIVSIRDEKVKRRARVTSVYAIEQERKVALADVLPAKPKRDTSEDSDRRKARKLAQTYSIEIEIERWDGYNRTVVWGPHWAPHVDEEELDPFHGDHYAEDWADALGRVEDYVELITKHPAWFVRG